MVHGSWNTTHTIHFFLYSAREGYSVTVARHVVQPISAAVCEVFDEPVNVTDTSAAQTAQ